MPIQKPNFGLDASYQQLALELELPEVESEGVSVDEAQRRSLTARSALVKLKGEFDQPSWYETFERLMEGGWPWRQATYIAWASIPKEGRKPETQSELAKQFLGLTSDRAISTWRRRNPAIDEMVTVLQSAPLWDHRADVFDALIGMAKEKDYKSHNDRKLFLELTGDYVPISKLAAELTRKLGADDLSNLSDAELSALAESVKQARETSASRSVEKNGE
jgi:hypothetical protein